MPYVEENLGTDVKLPQVCWISTSVCDEDHIAWMQ